MTHMTFYRGSDIEVTFPMKLTSLIFKKYHETIDLKVSKFQNELMKSSFLPKYYFINSF